MIDDRRRPIRIVPHAAWDAARERLLAGVAAGSRTMALVGEPGTGKSLLLRSLARELGKGGRAVMHIMQGDLPFALSPGCVLLIDEAARIPPAALAELLGQTAAVAILADEPGFLEEIQLAGPMPDIVRLRPLTRQEVGFFAEDWMQGEPNPISLTKAALARLVAESEGMPRVIVQLLAVALTLERDRSEPETVSEIADLRLELEPAPPPAEPCARRRAGTLALAVGTLLAVALYPARPAVLPRPALPPFSAADAMPPGLVRIAAPPPVETSAPLLVALAPPAPAELGAAPLQPALPSPEPASPELAGPGPAPTEPGGSAGAAWGQR